MWTAFLEYFGRLFPWLQTYKQLWEGKQRCALQQIYREHIHADFPPLNLFSKSQEYAEALGCVKQQAHNI